MSNAIMDPTPTDWNGQIMQKRIAQRYAAERRFKAMGFLAVALSTLFLAFLLFTMLGQGLRGFQRTEIAVDFDFPALTSGTTAAAISGPNADTALNSMDIPGIVELAMSQQYGAISEGLLTTGAAGNVRQMLIDNPGLVTSQQQLWLPVDSRLDVAFKRDGERAAEQAVAALAQKDALRTGFNWTFLTGADATDPSAVGIWAAFKGSLMTMAITLMLAFPVGVLAALYLEEYATKNRLTDMIEVSINNLAAVPSIIFGLLGLAVFLTLFGMPRSSALVGGLTLALMTMPVIVIAGRNAVKSVPPSIREAALGIGASPVQVVFHHVLPLALPGILTGTIIGMARALGETAPLLMIGMRAFIPAAPEGFTDATTALPVQIYLWSDEVNQGFVEKTSAAIIVLLIFLLGMNALAIYLRNRFETRW
ncbi:MAG: phosphate ABC transporter permease PstA [Sphingorhabdus sp.]|jgi:phosphate transport system permease protein|uniref:phosphate ABC transporter permease PstA n=1 Tax=Sphingorhabdus sp. TaxID=1902408 RepID=UPI00273EDF45|nr:phosphate ABC transporter permease PstA [Sphingorhabdus sp.]MDP4874369.1 phosphate ABC transporter permease PstA [Sphingorhabdus sp.]